MNDPISNHLLGVRLGKLRIMKNMAVVPLFFADAGPAYITLADAIDRQALTISEVDHAGEVNSLKAVNTGDAAILVLDGEELTGAKQNRVLNTTVLLKPKSETLLPVSCTEQGRWSYLSSAFAESGNVMSPLIRARKNQAVSENLKGDRGFASDQSGVWADIEAMAGRAGVASATMAMGDVFHGSAEGLNEFVDAFPLEEGQKGLVVFIDGRVVGTDMVSRVDCYHRLHDKLIRSYALDARLTARPMKGRPTAQAARDFVADIAGADQKQYKAVGQGKDYRLKSKSLVGSALAAGDAVVHMACFRSASQADGGSMTSLSFRRGFRY